MKITLATSYPCLAVFFCSVNGVLAAFKTSTERELKEIYGYLIVINVLFFLPLTSVDSGRCDSYCSARLFQNLPAPPKHYGVFDVFADFQCVCQPKKN